VKIQDYEDGTLEFIAKYQSVLIVNIGVEFYAEN